MRPENYFFGGGAAESIIHPVVLAGMIVTIILMFLLPRKYVIVPLFFLVFLTPFTQTIVIGGVHFFVLRILVIAAWMRLIGAKFSSGSLFKDRLGVLDKVFVVWAVFRVLAFLSRFSFQAGAWVPELGFLLDALGGYFLLRYLIQDEEDILRVIKIFALVVAVVGPAMLYERIVHINIFGYLGGIPIAPGLRDGAFRCQGPFRNPILAGCFAATVLPFFFILWTTGKYRLLALAAMVGAAIMVAASASSTPLMAFAGAIAVVCLWPVRKKMRALRWSIVIVLVLLQIAMNAPFWFLITHFELVGGSSNYHRAMLVDQFVRHFGDWWLIGTNDNGTWGWDMWDQANQYVAEGESGGLVAFSCFIAMLCISFAWLGKARKSVEGDRKKEWFLWLLGVALFAQMVSFFGISYYDQTQLGWYALLAMISAATFGPALQTGKETAGAHQTLPGGGIPFLRPVTPKPAFTARTLVRR